MKYLSLFTGVGGFDLGFDRAGMECVAQVEQDKHCLKVLEHHWPDVPKIKDVRDVTSEHFTHTTINLVCGGFPCQDVSVAGNRAGLAGNRSGLWFEFLRILQCVKPNWVVIENVPGLLSSNAGRDFATILHGLGECGYQSAWRILDSQYWGVAQRRRRLYLVGCLTDGRAAEVLFEREGGYWNTPSRSETGQGAPSLVGTLTSSNSGKSSPGNASETDVIVPTTWREQAHGVYQGDTKASPVKARDGKSATDLIAYRTAGYDQYAGAELASTVTVHEAKEFGDLITVKLDNTKSNGWGVLQDGTTHTLDGAMDAVAYTRNVNDIGVNVSPTLRDSSKGSGSEMLTHVRRLTPLECERLQGFPDGWTDVNDMSNAQRYRQMGNAVTVSVTEWLGRRIVATNGGTP